MNKKSLPFGGLFFMPNVKKMLKPLLLIEYFYTEKQLLIALFRAVNDKQMLKKIR